LQLPYNLAMLEAFTLANQPADAGLVPMLPPPPAHRRVHDGVRVDDAGQLARGLPPELGVALPGLATDAQRALQFVRSTPASAPRSSHENRRPRRGERRGGGHAARALEQFQRLFTAA